MKTLFSTALVFMGGAICGAGFLLLAAPHRAPTSAPSAGVGAWIPTREPGGKAPWQAPDTRIGFTVTREEQVYIQDQMLTFLTDLQALTAALAASDRDSILEIARGQAMPHDPNGLGQELRKSAPEGFTRISQSLRRDFAELADASASEPIEELQERVSSVLGQCAACHGSYAVSTTLSD